MTGGVGKGTGITPSTEVDGGTSVPTIESPTPSKPSSPKGPPKPAPQPKPKLPDPTPPSRGLGFQLNFQRAVISTTATGRATVTVRPNGTSAGLTPGNSYIPGVTAGPPTADQMPAMPETWTDVPFVDGGLFLRSGHSTPPGQIMVTVTYDVPIVGKADLITSVSTTDATEGVVNPEAGTITLNNSTAYVSPKQGDIVVINVTPKLQQATVTFTNSTELQNELATKVGGNLIVEAELSMTGSVGSTTGSTRQISVNYLTGGLDIKQD